MKRSIALLASIALAISLGTFVVESGPATVTIINVAPTINTIDILDDSYSIVGSVDPSYGVQVPYFFNVTIEDTNNVADIENVTIDIFKYAKEGVNNPQMAYKAWYNQTDLSQGQILPTGTDIYLLSVTFATIDSTHAICSFEYYFNGTANEATNWIFKARVTDTSFVLGTIVTEQFAMNPGAGITYYANAGGNSFDWDAAPEANVSAIFYTEATTNGGYVLNMSYSGAFVGGAVPWGAPTMWVKQIDQTNAKLVTTGAGVQWYSQIGVLYNHNATHLVYLEIPPGLGTGDTYSGVTIYVNVANSP